MTLASAMAGFVAGLTLDSIPDEIVDGARDRLLDALSTSIASRETETAQAVVAAVAAGDSDGGACTAIPTGGRVRAQDAALINGTAIHAILYEDYNVSSSDHPGAAVVPAALAAAESSTQLRGRGATIGDVLVAIVAGYEIQVKLGIVAAPGITSRGFRTTGVLGTVAASGAAASAFGLTREQTTAALGMGANMGSGFLEGFEHSTMEPYIHGGIAARNGILAALMGYGGVATAPRVFEGRTGYLAVFADVAQGEHEFPSEWMLRRVIAKPYPFSGGKASTVDGALALLEDGLDPRDIDHILIRLPHRIARFPGSDNKGPFSSMHEVQDSTQFVVAAALLGREMKALSTVKDHYADPDIAELSQRIDIVGEDDRYVDGRVVSTLEVTLRDGRTLTSEVDRSAEHLPTITSMSEKLRLLSSDAWTPERVERVIGLVTGDPGTPLQELSSALQG